MSKGASSHPVRIDRFFAGPGARADQWRHLVEMAEAWSGGSAAEKFEAALAEMTATEEFHAYPGLKLMSALRDHAAGDDASAAAALADASPAPCSPDRSVRTPASGTRTRMTRAWRRMYCRRHLAHGCPSALLRGLIVTGAPAARWPALATESRRLRRPQDSFVYEPVVVGSFEDASRATVLNTDLAAVIIHEGFPFRSRQMSPILWSIVEAADQKESAEVSACTGASAEARAAGA